MTPVAIKNPDLALDKGDMPQVKAKSRTGAHLYAGFISGMTSAVILQPLDLLKTRVQQSKGTSLTTTLKELSSVTSLWRGTLPSALRTSVGSALYFTILNSTRTKLATLLEPQDLGNDKALIKSRASSHLPVLSMQANLASGAFVRGLVGVFTMPITVVKVRYESSLYKYTSIADCCKHIFKQHGLKGFFYGYGVTVARDAPYAGLYVLFYEKSKDVLNKMVAARKQESTSKAALINSSAAMLSATLATTLTGPFDTIKTRVQLDPIKFQNFYKAAIVIVREGGVRDLFDGLSLRLARKAMSAGIAWCIYEELVRRA